MTTFDFQDGNGPVPAHQHKNGGGWVADSATVERTAQVFGDARVYGDAQVYGDARVFGDARLVKGYAFATKNKSWDITEVDNGDGTVTLYADAEFEPVSQVCECCGQRLAPTDKGENNE